MLGPCWVLGVRAPLGASIVKIVFTGRGWGLGCRFGPGMLCGSALASGAGWVSPCVLESGACDGGRICVPHHLIIQRVAAKGWGSDVWKEINACQSPLRENSRMLLLVLWPVNRIRMVEGRASEQRLHGRALARVESV